LFLSKNLAKATPRFQRFLFTTIFRFFLGEY
jgi:hypothetical protein